MKKIITFATGNANKVAIATERLAQYGITATQAIYEIDEIQ